MTLARSAVLAVEASVYFASSYADVTGFVEAIKLLGKPSKKR